MGFLSRGCSEFKFLSGICAEKNDAVVRITLPEGNKTILASKYLLYLPTERQLLRELKKDIGRLGKGRGDDE
jgi:hypothetical protein